MALRRPRAGFKRREINAELIEADGIAEPFAPAPHHVPPERFRIAGRVFKLEIGDVDLRHSQTRSMIVAVPMPAPMQSVTSPVERSRRSISSKSVPRIIAPVAPSGWPMAMAPPLTFTFDGSSLNACM